MYLERKKKLWMQSSLIFFIRWSKFK